MGITNNNRRSNLITAQKRGIDKSAKGLQRIILDMGLRKMKGVQEDQRKPDGVIYVYGWIRPGCGKWVEDNVPVGDHSVHRRTQVGKD